MFEVIKKVVSTFRKPGAFFLLVALVVGTVIVVVLPPFRGPDEAAHVFRVYQLTSGSVLLQKGTTEDGHDGLGYAIPDAIQRTNIAAFQEKGDSLTDRMHALYKAGTKKTTDTTQFQTFEGAGIYPPTSYANYLPASAVMKALKTNAYVYILLLRLSGLLICIALIYMAIRIIPFGKWLLVAIGLLPMSLHQMSVVSADGLIIASSILFCAVILYLRKTYDTFGVNKRKTLLMVVTLTVLAVILSSKPGYWPILFLLFLVPPSPKELFRKPAVVLTMVAAFAACLFLVWFAFISVNNQSDTKHFFEQANYHSKLVSKHQVLHQAVNPVSLGERFIETYVIQPYYPRIPKDFIANFQPSFIFDTFTGVFGSLEAYPPSWMAVTVVSSLFIAFSVEPVALGVGKLRKYDRLISLLLMVAGAGMLSLIFWLSWTAEDMPFIFGLQGRYFLPILPLLLFALPRKKVLTAKPSSLVSLLSILIVVNSVISLLTIYNYFYY